MTLRNRPQVRRPPKRPNASHPQKLVDIERAALRSICAFTGGAEQRQHLLQSLAGYSWHDPDHAVVYRALHSLPSRADAASWRELLPAAATRMGFPDLNWEYYFGDEDTVTDDVKRAIVRLFKTGKER
jgi:hypothetical protein